MGIDSDARGRDARGRDTMSAEEQPPTAKVPKGVVLDKDGKP